jgi:hypothetical protein
MPPLFAIVPLTLLKSAHQVFDAMPARDKVSKFEKFPIGFCSVADRDPRHMLVRSRVDGLVENEIDMGMVYV